MRMSKTKRRAPMPAAREPGTKPEEKCDVGRVDVEESAKEQACTQLNGNWQHHRCMDLMPFWDELVGSSTCDASVDWPFPGAAKKSTMVNMADSCCTKPNTECGIVDQNLCSNAGDFNASSMFGDSTCHDIANIIGMASNSINFCELTQEQCSSKPVMLGGETTVATFFQFAGMSCCGGQAPTAACSSTGCGNTQEEEEREEEEEEEGEVHECAELKEA